jgi:hypothetical protein
MFVVLWGGLAGIVAKPVVIGGDNVLDLAGNVYSELARSTEGRPCDKGKVIPLYLARYIFEATLPSKDDLNYEFFGLVDECTSPTLFFIPHLLSSVLTVGCLKCWGGLGFRTGSRLNPARA